MNNKQKMAADYYIELQNGYEALIKAGYSVKTAEKYESFFDRDDIKEYIYNRNKANTSDPTSEVITYLTKVMRGEEEDASATQRIKAAEMLSKHYGIDKEKSGAGCRLPVVIHDDL